jgi:superfamily II RNA helicase
MYNGKSCTDKARELDNEERAWQLSVAGNSKSAVARVLNVSGRTVQRYINRRAATFRNHAPTKETVQQVLLQTELLKEEQAAAVRQRKRVELDTKASETDKTFAIAALGRDISTLNKRIAAMNMLDAPIKIVEESRRIQVSIKGDALTWDRSILAKAVGPVPGLTIYEGCRNNGDTTDQVPGSPSN